MNKSTLSLLLIGFTMPAFAQNIGMGTLNPDPSAQVEISSHSRGLLIPRMDSLTLAGIPLPAKGLMVYDTARNMLLVNMGTADQPQWQNLVERTGWSLTGNMANYNSVLGTLNRPLQLTSGGIQAGIIQRDITTLGMFTPNYVSYLPGETEVGITAFGFSALKANTALANSAFGYAALSRTTSGNFNTAVGFRTLQNNQTGRINTGVGSYVMINNTGSFNTAMGGDALIGNTIGSSNTAIGVSALRGNTEAFYNTAVGYNAGSNYRNGYNNVFLGANTDVIGNDYFNVVAIGQSVTCTSSNQVRLGNSVTISIGGYANWTNFSDGRFKKNMKEAVPGLDFIMRLRPITYTLDIDGIEAKLRPDAAKEMHAGMLKARADKSAAVLTGFVAQEVEKAASDANYDFSGVDKPKNDKDFYGLRYADFVAPLVKAVQEQQHIIDELRKKVDALEKKSKQ